MTKMLAWQCHQTPGLQMICELQKCQVFCCTRIGSPNKLLTAVKCPWHALAPEISSDTPSRLENKALVRAWLCVCSGNQLHLSSLSVYWRLLYLLAEASWWGSVCCLVYRHGPPANIWRRLGLSCLPIEQRLLWEVAQFNVTLQFTWPENANFDGCWALFGSLPGGVQFAWTMPW